MTVDELYKLVKWVQSEVVEKDVTKAYQQLYAVLSKNAQPNQPTQSFEKEKSNLVSKLESISVDSLSSYQIEYLEKYGLYKYIGLEGISNINDILSSSGIDLVYAPQKINMIISQMNQGLQKLKQIDVGLTGLVEDKILMQLDNEILMSIRFAGQAAISNISDLKKWGNIWFEIGRGITMAHDMSPESIKIIGATKGSVILELVTNYDIMLTISTITLGVYKVVEDILDLWNTAEDLKTKNLEDIAENILSAAEDRKQKGITEIIEIVKSEIKLLPPDDSEKISNLTHSIKELMDFIEKGGTIDYTIPENHNEQEKNSTFQKLIETRPKLKVKEKRIEALEAYNKVSNDEEEKED